MKKRNQGKVPVESKAPEPFFIQDEDGQLTFNLNESGIKSNFYDLPNAIHELVQRGAIFYISHSGGKDSQAMYALVRDRIPADQIVVVHADLGEVEWPGVHEHIVSNTAHPVHVVRAGKTLLEMVEKRKKWPSVSCRQCTSDLKRGPILKFIRHDLKRRGARIAVNCTGIRAEESTARAKKIPFRFNPAESCGHREQWDWMSIFDLTTSEVFHTIEDAGQQPFWAYERNDRLSCVFCIMGSLNDLRHGAEQNPELYRKYVELEKRIGHTMFTRGGEPVSLEEYTGIRCSSTHITTGDEPPGGGGSIT